MAEKIMLYTDGACSGNPGPGGWAAILRYGEHEKLEAVWAAVLNGQTIGCVA